MELDLFVLNVDCLHSEEHNDELDNVVEHFDPNIVRVESVVLVGADTVVVVYDHVYDERNEQVLKNHWLHQAPLVVDDQLDSVYLKEMHVFRLW